MRTRLVMVLIGLAGTLAPTLFGQTNATVEFYLRTFSMGSQTRFLTLTPAYNPLTDATNIFWGLPLKVYPTNGVARVTNLVANTYTVALDGASRTFTIYVPETNGVLNAANLTTNLTAYSTMGPVPVYVTNTYNFTNGEASAGVASFNTRTGAVALALADVLGVGVLTNVAVFPAGALTGDKAAISMTNDAGQLVWKVTPNGQYFYESASNTVSLSSTGDATFAGDVTANSFIGTATRALTADSATAADSALVSLAALGVAPGITNQWRKDATNVAAAAVAGLEAMIVSNTAGVASFNSRTGVVTLASADVTTALGFTPQPTNATLSRLAATGAVTNTMTNVTLSGAFTGTLAGAATSAATASSATVALTANAVTAGITNQWREDATNIHNALVGTDSQTPWRMNIDGGGYDLTGVSNVTATGTATFGYASITELFLRGEGDPIHLQPSSVSELTFLGDDDEYCDLIANQFYAGGGSGGFYGPHYGDSVGTFTGSVVATNFTFSDTNWLSWTAEDGSSYLSNRVTGKYSLIDSNLNVVSQGTNTAVELQANTLVVSNAVALVGTITTASNLVSSSTLERPTVYGNLLADTTEQSRLVFTNMVPIFGYNTNSAATNSLALLFRNCGIPTDGATNPLTQWDKFTQTRIRFQSWTNPSSYFEWYFYPYHDKGGEYYGDDEMQQTSSGGWAVSTGYGFTLNNTSTDLNNARRAWQWGIGGYGMPFIYHFQSHYGDAVNTNLTGASYPEQWRSFYYTNAQGSVGTPRIAGVGSAYGDNYQLPTKWFKSLDTNGLGAWIFYDNLDVAVDANKNWANQETARKRFQIIVGPDNKPSSDLRGVSITGGITINDKPGITTNYPINETLSAFFERGLLVAISNTPVPVAYWDDDATNFMDALVTDLETPLATNINTLVKALKSDGTWTNLQALYPFAGANGDSNSVNLIDPTTYKIAWSGTPEINDETGVKGNGTNFYGNTTWKSTETNGFIFAFIKQWPTNTARRFAGARTATGSVQLYNGSTSSNASVGFNASAANGVFAVTVLIPGAVASGRTNATDQLSYYSHSTGIFKQSSADASTAPIDAPVFLLTRNYVGDSTNGFSDGWLQAFAATTNALTINHFTTLYSAITNLNAQLGR